MHLEILRDPVGCVLLGFGARTFRQTPGQHSEIHTRMRPGELWRCVTVRYAKTEAAARISGTSSLYDSLGHICAAGQSQKPFSPMSDTARHR